MELLNEEVALIRLAQDLGTLIDLGLVEAVVYTGEQGRPIRYGVTAHARALSEIHAAQEMHA